MAAHRYWRVYVTAVQSSSVVSCATLAFREVSGGANVATGGTAMGSGGSGSSAPSMAFDADGSTYWQVPSVPSWIGYDFGVGVTKDIVEFAWTASSVASVDQNPKDCQLEWSDDGTTWWGAWPVLGISVWTTGQTKTFGAPNISTNISASSSPGTLLFVGGELEDFILSVQTSNISFSTTGSSFRTGYARGSINVGGTTANNIWANFTASTSFGVSVRSVSQVTSSLVTTPFLTLGVGANARLRLRRTTAADVSTLTLEKFDGTTATSLAVSTATYAITSLHKIDVLVDNYGASGRVRIFVNNAPYIDTGVMDITAASATALDRLTLFSVYSTTSFTTYYSEVLVASEDTRPLNVVTMAPNGLGDVNTNVIGGWAEIDDLTGSDLDTAVMDTAGQALSVNLNGVPSGATGFGVRGIKMISASARGATGPSRLAMGVRTGGTNAYATSVLLDTGYSNNSITYATNPVTGNAWTAAELDLLQLAFKAET